MPSKLGKTNSIFFIFNASKIYNEVHPIVIATDMGELNAQYMKIASELNIKVIVDEDEGTEEYKIENESSITNELEKSQEKISGLWRDWDALSSRMQLKQSSEMPINPEVQAILSENSMVQNDLKKFVESLLLNY